MSILSSEAPRQAHNLIVLTQIKSAGVKPHAAPAAPPKPVTLDSLAEQVEQQVDRVDIASRISTLPDDALRLTEGLSDTFQAAQSLAEAAEHIDDTVLMADLLADASQKSRLAALVAQSSDEGLLWLARQGSRHGQSVGRVQTALNKGVQSMQALPGLRWWFKPQVQNTLNNKVFPTVNAVGASVAMYQNSQRFAEARATGNTRGQVISGIQIGLNATSGIAGFIPGKGQVVSTVAGVTSLIMGWTLD